MFAIHSAFDRLFEAAMISLMILMAGSVAVLVCRQPIRRMRIIVATLAACLLAPAVSLVPGLPRWSLPRARVEHQIAANPIGAATSSQRGLENVERGSWIVDREIDSVRSEDLEAPMEIGERAVTTTPPIAPISETNDSHDLPGSTPSFLSHTAPPKSPSTIATTEPPSTIDDPPSTIRKSYADFRSWLVGAYFGGLLLVSVWWLAGLVALKRILCGAHAAPNWCRDLLKDIAGPAGDRVQLLVSPRAAQPFTFTCRRPVIVLPAAMVAEGDASAPRSTIHDLQSTISYSLAHEWSHIARGDAWTWSLSGVVRLIYFYQPLCWWLRRQLRLCQDYLADAAAARQSSPTDYAEFLATRALGRPLALGLGITAGKSDLYRRVAMLVKNDRPLESRCPWWWSAGVATAAVALVLIAGTFGQRAESLAESETSGWLGSERSAAPSDAQAGGSRWSTPATPTDTSLAPGDGADTLTTTDTDASVGSPSDDRPPETDESRANELRLVDATAVQAAEQKPADDKVAEQPDPAAKSSASTQALIDAILAQADRIKSGRLDYISATTQSGKSIVDGKYQACFRGDSWAERRNVGEQDQKVFQVVRHAGRYMRLHRQASGEETQWRLTVAWPQENPQGQISTFTGGNGLASLRRNRDAAQHRGVETINGAETEILEWPASPADKPHFGSSHQQRPLAKVRVYVAPQLGHAVVRIKQVDTFGLTLSLADFAEFKEVAAGVWFPHTVILQGPTTLRKLTVKDVNINEEIPDREFAIRIPAGTHVEDTRPHRDDAFVQSGSQKSKRTDYPLRNFVVWTEEPDGLPPAVLAEMDRDLLTLEEREQRKKEQLHRKTKGSDLSAVSPKSGSGPQATVREAGPPAGAADASASTGSSSANSSAVPAQSADRTDAPQPPKSSSGKSTARTVPAAPSAPTPATSPVLPQGGFILIYDEETGKMKRTPAPPPNYRYAGKTFAEWRATLINDLDFQTRVQALEAVSAFGATAHADEVAAAIQEALQTDEPESNKFLVQQAAARALARLGVKGLPGLEAQLASESHPIRASAVNELCGMAAKTDAVIPALLRATKDADFALRNAAFRALIRRHLQVAGVRDAVIAALGDERAVTSEAILDALSDRADVTGIQDALVPLLARSEGALATKAAVLLTVFGPESAEIAEKIKRTMLNSGISLRWKFLRSLDLHYSRGHLTGRAPTVIPVVAALLESEKTWTEFDPDETTKDAFPQHLFEILGRLGDDATFPSALPVLIKAADGKLRIDAIEIRLAAISALEIAGPAAKDALPVLERLLKEMQPLNRGVADEKVLRRWESTLQSAIQKIKGE